MMESNDARADRLDRSSAAMEELSVANAESTRAMMSLVDEVRTETRGQDRKIEALDRNHRQMRAMIYMMVVTVVILLAIAVVNASNIASTRHQQAQLRQINATLLDCVNSTGNCGRVNALQQESFVNEVKKYNLIGFYCIRNNPGTTDPKAEKFLQCMERLYPGGPTLTGR